MGCTFADNEENRRYAQRVTREAIKAVDGGNRSVTQGTVLGAGGLGHLSQKRKRYCAQINIRLAENDSTCRLSDAACAAVRDPSLTFVSDVTNIVYRDI